MTGRESWTAFKLPEILARAMGGGRASSQQPGTQLQFEREGDTIRVTVEGAVPPSRIDEGHGLLKAARVRGQRRLSDFDPAVAMRESGRR